MLTGPDIIIFGGTFDPPHEGHVDCVKEALKRFPNTEIWILPGAQPAVAGGGGKRSVASFHHRFEMARLAFEDIVPGRIHVIPLELDLPRPNYTWVTLAHIAETNPGKKLGLLMGQDQVRSFAGWKNPNIILDGADLIAVRRRRTDEEEPASGSPLREAALALIQELELTGTWNPGGDVCRFKEVRGSVTLIDTPLSPAQSSDIRHRIAASTNAPAGWIPESVLEYLKDANLYGPGLFSERI